MHVLSLMNRDSIFFQRKYFRRLFYIYILYKFFLKLLKTWKIKDQILQLKSSSLYFNKNSIVDLNILDFYFVRLVDYINLY